MSGSMWGLFSTKEFSGYSSTGSKNCSIGAQAFATTLGWVSLAIKVSSSLSISLPIGSNAVHSLRHQLTFTEFVQTVQEQKSISACSVLSSTLVHKETE